MLWLIQQRRQQEPEFRDVLRRVVSRLDRLHATAPGRWEHLLWFAHALVYHAREKPQREPLAEFIRASVRKPEQPEVQIMGKTIAEALMDEGELRGKRETLLRQLRLKFKRVSGGIITEIEATQDGGQLDAWLDAIVIADRISDMPFHANQKS